MKRIRRPRDKKSRGILYKNVCCNGVYIELPPPEHDASFYLDDPKEARELAKMLTKWADWRDSLGKE